MYNPENKQIDLGCLLGMKIHMNRSRMSEIESLETSGRLINLVSNHEGIFNCLIVVFDRVPLSIRCNH
jgi:hypothetical protein